MNVRGEVYAQSAATIIESLDAYLSHDGGTHSTELQSSPIHSSIS